MVDSGLGMADAGHVGHGEISVSPRGFVPGDIR